jgi:predicted dehydrogenase
MKQVVQPLRGGPVAVLDVPRPTIGPTEVLVRTLASVVSPGTERAVTALAQSSLLGKAKARPDLVRAVVAKARAQGAAAAVQAVRARLATDTPLGYSAAGIAVSVGEAVFGVRPGMLVATGGAGRANHAEWQAVPGLLCAPVPDGVRAEDAAFATLGSIALHGVRQADAGPGSRVVVVGLGLIGQLVARILAASGCQVAGIDVAERPLALARRAGVLALGEEGEATTAAVLEWSRGRGADAVLLCAADSGSAAVNRAPALCRDRGTVVVVGDVGLELSRTPFYAKELDLRFARSYGPGRYDGSYEDYGVDYPVGYVRWTEGRNLEAVLDLLACGRLRVDDLVTHCFDIADAADAYRLIETRREPYLAVRLRYPESATAAAPIVLRTAAARPATGVGWLGAGGFSTGTLLPAFRDAGFPRFVAVASAHGLSARRVAERFGFEKVAAEPEDVIDDPAVDTVVIATTHDRHAELAIRALRAGKHVWCEKPPALTLDELDQLTELCDASAGVLFLGYNRRWSPALRAVRDRLGDAGPMSVVYRVAAGPVPEQHWYHDRRQGGRDEPGLTGDVGLLIRHRDGSVSTVGYAASAPAGLGKERVEILAGPRHALIDDYRRVLVDGRRGWSGQQDKGHRAAVAAFRDALRGGPPPDVLADTLLSTRATLAALAAAGTSHDERPPSPATDWEPTSSVP